MESEQRAKREDHETVEDVYARHSEALTRFATGLVGRSDAQDLVATAIAKCLKARNWNSLSDPGAYLYQAVFNESRTLYRRAVVRSRGHAPAGSTRTIAPDHSVATTDGIAVSNALLSLPPRQRAVIVLTYWEDLSIKNAADRLGISEGSVKKHLARARATLRKEMQ